MMRRFQLGVEEHHPFYFEGLLVSIFIPILWVIGLLLAVGSSGELGCIFSDTWACARPWSNHKQIVFFVLLLGPPLVIWTIWVIVAWIIRTFSTPN